MPPKTVTCSICSSTVLKAQTFARTDGTRACRSHEGVSAEAAERAAAERARLDKALDKGTMLDQWARNHQAEAARYSVQFEKESAEFREQIYSHCWTCGEYGLEGREFFAQAMIAMKRLELRGQFDFLNMGKDVRSLMGNIPLLTPVKLQDEVMDRAIVKHVSDRRIRDLVPFLGFVLMWPPCADKHGFRKRLEDLMPKPTWEQMENMMTVVVGMEPVLRVLAEKKEGQS